MRWNSADPGPDRYDQSSRVTWSSIPPDGPGLSQTGPASICLVRSESNDCGRGRPLVVTASIGLPPTGPVWSDGQRHVGHKVAFVIGRRQVYRPATGEIMCIVGQYIPSERVDEGWSRWEGRAIPGSWCAWSVLECRVVKRRFFMYRFVIIISYQYKLKQKFVTKINVIQKIFKYNL